MTSTRYKELQRSVAALSKEVVQGTTAIRAHGGLINDEAQDTGHIAQMIAGMKVDAQSVGETTELTKIMRGFSDGTIDYIASGDTTAKLANAAHDQAQTTHQGIYEAMSRADVDGKYDVDREWLRQE